MATVTKTKTAVKISAAQAFRNSLTVKTLKDDEAIVTYVRKTSGSTTFNVKTLAWYRSMHQAGKLSKGTASAKNN